MPNLSSNSRPTSKWKSFVQNNLLTLLTIIGVFGGGTLGIMLKNSGAVWSPRDIMYLQFPGDLFLR